jgi:hypothetical protein
MSNEALKPVSEDKRRWGRAQGSRLVDPYKNPGKLPAMTVCPTCGAIYTGGKWQWGPRPAEANEVVCQACHRSEDGVPAGVVTLSGSFVAPNRAALLALVQEHEESERRERPPNRIINIEQGEDRMVVNTTDVQLPVRIGEAIRRSFQGALERHFDEDSYLIRVDWRRDA